MVAISKIAVLFIFLSLTDGFVSILTPFLVNKLLF
jgi:hypothetical protein